MGEIMSRTHYCAELSDGMVGREVTVMGWVHKRRDLGKLIFIALRDRTGIVQATIDGNKTEETLFKKAESIRGEFVLAIRGLVCARTAENINESMKTGRVEIEASDIIILSEAEVPPFQVADVGVNNDLRLKYRYLDLRRPELQNKFIIRHKITRTIHEFLDAEGFINIETPLLTKSTPEGARDYLVPSRIYPGNFYALPQSPQIFKQLLMVSGFDRYYQIARCFRDEDLRADRQPEFTQIDMELSFVDIEYILDLNERLMKALFKEVLNVDLHVPFRRMPYVEAMERFGSDKPDTRFGMELKNVSDIVRGSSFKVFEDALNAGGSVRGINATGCGSFSRKQIDALADFVKDYNAKNLVWIIMTDSGGIRTSVSKFFDEDKLREIAVAFDAKIGDLILLCADKDEVVFAALGALRVELAQKTMLLSKGEYEFLWVIEFPLFEWSEEDSRYYAKHHPFTAPLDEDIELLAGNPAKARAKAYDMVVNGTEIGGGSLRIYSRDIQKKMFEVLGFSNEDAQERFGFMLDAFRYGVPPHGGIAYGLDRIAMLMTDSNSIRDVIAFPKVKDASCPMTDAPGEVDKKQLKELGLLK